MGTIEVTFHRLPPVDRDRIVLTDGVLERIERPDHAVFGPRVRLTTYNRLALAAGVWFRSKFS
jgi:hypothetical protein